MVFCVYVTYREFRNGVEYQICLDHLIVNFLVKETEKLFIPSVVYLSIAEKKIILSLQTDHVTLPDNTLRQAMTSTVS